MASIEPSDDPGNDADASSSAKNDSHYDLGAQTLIPEDHLSAPSPTHTPLHRQFYWCVWKNVLLISRRPITLFFMLFSSVFSVLLSWPAGRNVDPARYPDSSLFDQCGVVQEYILQEKYGHDRYYYSDNIVLNLNDSWNNGLAITVLCLGPLIHALFVLNLLHFEIQKKLVGVVRGLGIRDIVYWMSWYIPLFFTSFFNALFGAVTAQFLPVHIFQNVYFGGIFGSLLFLHMALTAASFFLAAVCGSNGKLMVMMILLMIISVFIPPIVTNAASGGGYYSPLDYQSLRYPYYSISGLSWLNFNTQKSKYEYNYNGGSYNATSGSWEYIDDDDELYTFESCNYPVMSEEEGTNFKTTEETNQVTPDEFFIGCYIQPGFTGAMWNLNSPLGFGALYLVPYFHITSIYSNFIGYSGNPGKSFTSKQASMSPEDLAVDALPTQPNEVFSRGTTLFQQGSTLHISYYNYKYDEKELFYLMYGESPKLCPSQNFTEYEFCDDINECKYAKKSKPISSPSVHDIFGHLVLLSMIYLLMALTWLQLLPAGNGKRVQLFPCLKSNKEKSGETDESLTQSILIENVSKNYGSCKAVTSMSLQLKRGQITALLGHNGAGKSTLTNILSCETDPSSGEVFIFGRSAVHDSFNIRRLMGICKQDDFLWPTLTAKEHLDIFAGLRGVAPDDHDETVQKWLESVDLSINQHTTSSAFSGGMKRRLSVALSTIGERPFLIFDEPTTGMDPVSRRFVWKHLDNIKDNKVILLTTHAMEEADLLADEVAIMKKGKLAALGSPLELKSEHGSAIQFDLLVDKDKVEETKRLITEMFSQYGDLINVSNGDSGNISVRIEAVKTQSTESDDVVDGVDVTTLTHFIEWLEDDSNNILEYGFSNSSLEEVFINITKDDNEEENVSPVNQGDEIADDDESEIDYEQNGDNVSRMQPKLTMSGQIMALVHLSFIRKWTGLRRSLFEYILFSLFAIATILEGMGIATWRGGWNSIFIIYLQVVPIAGLSLLVVSTVFPLYHDKTQGLLHLMRTQGLFNSSYIIANVSYSFVISFVYGTILMTLLFATPLFRETRQCDFYRSDLNYGDFQNFDEDREPIICYSYWYNDESEFGKVCQSTGKDFATVIDGEGINLTTVDTPGDYWQLFVVALMFALSMPGALFLSSIIPGNYKFCMVVVGFFTVLAFLFPVLYTTYNQFRAIDDYYDYDYYGYMDDDDQTQKKTFIEICLESIDPDNICEDLATSLASNITQEQFLNCMGKNLLIENILGPYCNPSFVSLLPQHGAFQLIAFAIYSKVKFWPESMTAFRTVFPNDDGFCSGDICKIPFIQKAYRKNLLFFFLGALLLNLIGFSFYMLRTFPTTLTLRIKNLCWRIVASSKNIGKQEETSEEDYNNEEVMNEKRNVIENLDPFTRTDIAVEEPLVIDYDAKQSCSDLPPIIMHNLRKVYPRAGRSPPKVALKSLSLQVAKGEVCGLLGKNGSGKTTALKILSCDHDSSSGLALVSGYDVRTEKNQALESLGNCPQFDVVWPSLSVGEHLEFFARLKGFAAKEIKTVSQAMAKAVGLGSIDVYNRRARDLSGGMRRRLSIAIALLGAPGVFLLDEPTTGLDPKTRNNLWDLITSFATKDRAIIITTHMMIEADTLCNRIAIIGQGRLKVVATQQHLKDKYGSGYVLQLNLIKSSQEFQNKAMEFARNYLHPEATLSHKQAKTLHVHLPRDIDLTTVFNNLYSPARITEGCINQFLLSQSSLEDVFLALGD